MANRVALITFKGHKAGRLEEISPNGTRFIYDPGWQEDIACALPASTQEYIWKVGLHPFFEHLGPEGWLREKQARASGVSGQDDFGLLLQYGRDCIGAVGIQPLQELPTPKSDADPVTRAAVQSKRTMSGVQKKALVFGSGGSFQPSGENDQATHIAKFNGDEEKTFVENEALSLQLAVDALGAREVTKFQVSSVKGFDEIALIVERFDRTQGGDKLRLEDFAQILSKPRGRDFHGKYDGSYEEIATAIRRHSVRPEIDVGRFFQRVVFNIIIGKADAHLKNFSLLESSDGLRLSPTYDVLNSLIYGGRFDREVALTLCGEKSLLDDVGGGLLRKFGLAIGLSERAVEIGLKDIVARVGKSRITQKTGLDDPAGFRGRYAEIIQNACARISQS
jgi:serine/threonine-protein kinase HipA